MRPPHFCRRTLLAAAACSWAPNSLLAVPPPTGSVMLLLPILDSRVRLAQITADTASKQWASLQAQLNKPPFTDPDLPAFEGGFGDRRFVPRVGNEWRLLTQRYERELKYDRTLSADDRKQCFPRDDESCAALQIVADLDYRDLLRNAVIDALQASEDELGYLARCDSEPATCAAADAASAGEKLLEANAAFDRYLDTIPSDEISKGMKMLGAALARSSDGKTTLTRVVDEPAGR